MPDQLKKIGDASVNLNLIRQFYWTPIAVCMVGLISFAMLGWMNKINHRQRADFDLADALMDIQIRIGSSHVLLEEDISGDRPMRLEEVSGEIDLAASLGEALLHGGKSEHGFPIEPLTDSRLLKRAEHIHALLLQYKAMALQRFHDRNAARPGSDLYDRFHAAYRGIRDEAQALEVVLETDQIHAQAKARKLFLGILIGWISGVVIATTGLWNREARRRAAELALQGANKQLQAQTEELGKHRGRLTELVGERTAELTTANRYLQQEIIERKQAEESLRASEDKCRILVNYLPQKIYLKDQDSVYVHCNENFARDLGMKPDEIIGKTDYDLFPPEIAERNRAEDKHIMESGKPLDVEEKHGKEGEEVVTHKFKMLIHEAPGGVKGILGILWDVTERVRLEAIAEAVTTMNNIGSIFAGIRHEIGNPINSVKMTLNVLQKRIDTFSKERIEEYIERAVGEISRVQYLLGTLKSFNMYETQALRDVEMKPFTENFLSLLRDDFGKKGIAVETMFGPGAQWGHGDPRALQQVMLNVMSNASDALEGRKNPKVVIQVTRGDHVIWIRVADNGCGMSEEQGKRLFTPFFTTKASGTGLGLVVAKKLLAGMNGTLEIKSRRDEGTTVEISIPEGSHEDGAFTEDISHH